MELNHSRENCWYSSVCSIYAEDCINHCLRYEEMNFLMNNSGIPKSKQIPSSLIPQGDNDLESFMRLKEIKDNIVDFVSKGKNVYIYSKSTGNGKTSWAIKLMLKYFNDIWAGNGFRVRGVFVHVPTLLLQLKDFNNPLSKEYRDNLLNADLVIWDDIASTSMSAYDYTQLLSFIDSRMLNDKSNIFTSNISYNLSKVVGDRLASRIESAEQIEICGRDMRYGSSNTDTK